MADVHACVVDNGFAGSESHGVWRWGIKGSEYDVDACLEPFEATARCVYKAYPARFLGNSRGAVTPSAILGTAQYGQLSGGERMVLIAQQLALDLVHEVKEMGTGVEPCGLVDKNLSVHSGPVLNDRRAEA